MAGNNELALALRRVRKSLGREEKLGKELPQEAFAIRCGLSVSLIRNWEQQRTAPRFDQLACLIRGAGKYVAEILVATGLTDQEIDVLSRHLSGQKAKHPRATEGVVGAAIGIQGVASPGTQRKEIAQAAAQAERNLKVLYELGLLGLADTQHVLHCVSRRLRERVESIMASEEKKRAQAARDSESDNNSSLAPASRSAK